MMLKKILIGAAFAAISLAAGAETAEQVINVYTDNDRVPDYCYSVILIDNIEPNGRTERMELKQFGSGWNGLKNTVFEFTKPASVKDTRILQAEKTAKSDDRWIYMPALRSIRRLAAGDRHKSFVGSELTYNDMTLRKKDEDRNEMVEENASVTVAGRTYSCWKIKSTPIKRSEVEYGHRISYFDKKTYIPVRIEYYDKKDAGKMIKVTDVEKLEMVKGATGVEYPLRRQNLVTNLVTGRKSRVIVKDFRFDEKISDNYFSQQWLASGKAR